MKVLSVNVGLPQSLIVKDGVVQSSICKRPVNGIVTIRRTNLDGDAQADSAVHGGANKAVYVYPSEYYSFWRAEFPELDLPFGSFGENLTTEGLLDEQVFAGDRYQAGSAVLQVTQPRMPCYKLAARLGRPQILERMIAVHKHGFYLSVVAEGAVCAGDAISLLARNPSSLSMLELVSVYLGHSTEPRLLERAMSVEGLSPKWKTKLALRASL